MATAGGGMLRRSGDQCRSSVIRAARAPENAVQMAGKLQELRKLAETEISQPGRWGTTFT
jgi:hypothetical protein